MLVVLNTNLFIILINNIKMSIDISVNEPVFPIRTAAKLLNISVHTLRMYEREGLILPYKKNSSHRLYSKADLERLECIRAAINSQKISIAGIRTLYSMIPCWKILDCGEDGRTCKVFEQHAQPCWNLKHRNNFCDTKECRNCEIYMNFGTCQRIKEKINDLLISKN
jgi:MerR family transcriptional regulator, heat shock protein HspR